MDQLSRSDDLLGQLEAGDWDLEVSGASRRVGVGPALRQVGFVGEAELRLLRSAPPVAGEVFGALLRFAELAGVGAQTTCGFGPSKSPCLPLDDFAGCRPPVTGRRRMSRRGLDQWLADLYGVMAQDDIR